MLSYKASARPHNNNSVRFSFMGLAVLMHLIERNQLRNFSLSESKPQQLPLFSKHLSKSYKENDDYRSHYGKLTSLTDCKFVLGGFMVNKSD